MQKVTLNVNGWPRTLVVDPNMSLMDALRKQLSLTGTKDGCEDGHCGSCAVLVDGKYTLACITKMNKIPDGADILTVEGIGTPEHLHPIQKAFVLHGVAQCGFCTPGFVVSTYALLQENRNPTREEIRAWFQKRHNVCRCNAYIPYVDAVIDAAAVMRGAKPESELEYRAENGHIWGSKYPRPTAVAKVTGTLDYGSDLGLKLPPNTLRLALVQSEVSHANILSIDTSEAEKMPGVYAVLTHKDVKGKNRITGLITFPTNKGDGWDRPILCDEKVFQYGDAIAIVCADTEENARAAADKVVVKLEELPAYMSAPEAMAEDAIEIHPGTPNVYFEQRIAKGEDTGPLMESAAYVVEDEFYLQRQPHLTVEPDVGFAYFDEEDRLTIHSKSIGLYLHRAMIAPGLGIEPEKLRMVSNPAGATFGYKFCPTMEALLGVAAMATGRPVYLRYNYHQFMTYTGKRSPFFIKLRMGADEDGKIIAMESDWSVDHGPYSEFGDLLTLRGAQFIGAGYDIPNIRGIGRTVCTNHAWGSPFRAYGSPQSFLASESLVDELAEEIGIDPLELRYRNVYRPGATTPTGQTPEVFVLPQMIDLLRPKYQEALARAQANSTTTNKKGVGVAIGIYGCGLDGKDGAEAWAELTEDGVTIYATWQDHGQGADIGALSTAHQALLPLELEPYQIKLVMNDTAKVPNSGPSGGSRSQVMTGNAIRVACENLMDAMRKPDGEFRSYGEMIEEGLPLLYTGQWSASMNTNCDENAQGSPFAIYMYGVFMAEVDVEVATGRTTVEKFTLVADIGKVNNELVVEGQLFGGIAQGIGLALSEDFEDIHRHSTMLGAGVPYIRDIPDNIEIIHLETPRDLGPFGAAGVGELPLTSPHVAIVNAIKNATGARVRNLPARPEKVLAAMNGAH